MIRDHELTWMRMPEEPAARPPDEDEEDGHAMYDAAQRAVEKVCGAGKQQVSMFLPRTVGFDGSRDGDWEELTSDSRSWRWQPAGPIERQGHEANSLAAFNTVFEMQRKIATGGFSEVHFAVRRRTGEGVAVKKLTSFDHSSDSDITTEADLLRRLDHPHIIHTFDCYNQGRQIYLVQEYAAGGELFNWCRERRRPVREPDHRRIAYQLLDGLSYLHAHGVIHRDIKPKNVLMMSSSDDANLRITDFGLSRQLKKPSGAAGVLTSPVRDLGLDATRTRRARSVTRSFVGTADWMAPEVLVCATRENNAGYSFPADVWGAGCVLFALMVGRLDDTSPFNPAANPAANPPKAGRCADADGSRERTVPRESAYSSLFENILEKRLSFAELPSAGAKDLLQRLLALKPHERCSASGALSHSWLAFERPSANNPFGITAPALNRRASASCVAGLVGGQRSRRSSLVGTPRGASPKPPSQHVSPSTPRAETSPRGFGVATQSARRAGAAANDASPRDSPKVSPVLTRRASAIAESQRKTPSPTNVPRDRSPMTLRLPRMSSLPRSLSNNRSVTPSPPPTPSYKSQFPSPPSPTSPRDRSPAAGFKVPSENGPTGIMRPPPLNKPVPLRASPTPSSP